MSRFSVWRCFAAALVLAQAAVAARPAAADWLFPRFFGRCCPAPCDVSPYAEPMQPPQTGDDAPMAPMPDGMDMVPMDPSIDPGLDAGLGPFDTSLASLSGGSGTHILGRADSFNRFNLFDNMGAVPITRFWGTFQYLEGFDPQVLAIDTGRPNLTAWRFGGEILLNDVSSFAAQGMFFQTSDTLVGEPGDILDSWGNPQFMFKRIVLRGPCTVISGTLGIIPAVATKPQTINERFSRLQPGVLVYHDMGGGRFIQGGTQFNVPLNSSTTTSVDWVVSVGRWLYRYPTLCGLGGGRPLICGMTVQAEILGKHVTGDNIIPGQFLIEEDRFSESETNFPFREDGLVAVPFEENRHIIDYTVGTTILFCNNTSLGLAFSGPFTDANTRRAEFIMTYNYYY